MVLSQGKKVFLGTSAGIGFCYVTFFAFQNKTSGHNLFDVNKPEAVERGMSKAEKDFLKEADPSAKK